MLFCFSFASFGLVLFALFGLVWLLAWLRGFLLRRATFVEQSTIPGCTSRGGPRRDEIERIYELSFLLFYPLSFVFPVVLVCFWVALP